jgi:hypothetical protein
MRRVTTVAGAGVTVAGAIAGNGFLRQLSGSGNGAAFLFPSCQFHCTERTIENCAGSRSQKCFNDLRAHSGDAGTPGTTVN